MNLTYSVHELPYPGDSRAAFAPLQPLVGSFLLYSSQGFQQEGFDIFSALPIRKIRLDAKTTEQPDIDRSLDEMIAQLQGHACPQVSHPMPGWFGLMSYELLRQQRAMSTASQTLAVPAIEAGFYPVIFVVDHSRHRLLLIMLAGFEALGTRLQAQLAESAPMASFALDAAFTANLDQQQYRERFEQVQQYLLSGDCYQVNLARRFSAPYQGNAWVAFKHLSEQLPAPMSGYFHCENVDCVSLSPERFVSVIDGIITTHPIKGTRPRSSIPELDQELVTALQHSEKDRAENLMIVDLLRNDLGRSCEPGSIAVTRLFGIESFANVHHLVSTVEGRLRADVHPLKALLAAFPGGSITGAPKRRSMEIIEELEPDTRGFYCGSAFYCDVSNRLDSSILIRTLVADGGWIYCWSGGGIVVDSTWEQEFQETLDKVGLILTTLEQPRSPAENDSDS